ncbi:alpha/beta hydrolase [Paracoccaceae bacterium Fryx2]|nr:alpha/beta hydrolase [Paracoccaceae bacterium Fryx2]
MPEDMIAGHRTAWRAWAHGPRPVLALHCSLAHAGAWGALAERLEGVSVTAPDLPGHGRSADWDGRQDLHGLSTRIADELAARLGAGAPIDLIGHSFGATVALRLALERPERVRSLVLIEPVLFAAARSADDPAFGPFMAEHQAFARAQAEGRPEDAAAMFHGIWGTGAYADLPDAQRRYILHRIPLVVAQSPVLLKDAAGMPAQMRLESLGVPVLLLEGGDSPPVIAAIQGELCRRLPMVRRHVVPGAGHMVPITHAQAVAVAVNAHLAAS